MGSTCEAVYPLNADHLGMSQFSSCDDLNYRHVLGAIKSLLQYIEQNGNAYTNAAQYEQSDR
jgi:hypothetical protein